MKMLENIYTTKMSASKRTLQTRFAKIRSGSGKLSKMMAAVTSAFLLSALIAATVTAAALSNGETNFYVNGKGYAIEPILIENQLATHTDNFYLPLRKTFETLGYKVDYDVDKTKYKNEFDNYEVFPVFDENIVSMPTDDGGSFTMDISKKWQKPLVTNDADYYIYGATGRFNRLFPIIEMTKDGKTEYCQIGSKNYSTGYANAPVLIDGVTYIPLRIVATIVGGYDNVQWDDAKHDTFFQGALTFDENTGTITITTK